MSAAGPSQGARPLGGKAARSAASGGAIMSSALEVQGLHTFYGKSHILHGVGLTVGEGEVVTLLGRNGAGRTTTMRAILGLTGARKGSIKVNGTETTLGAVLIFDGGNLLEQLDRAPALLGRDGDEVVEPIRGGG